MRSKATHGRSNRARFTADVSSQTTMSLTFGLSSAKDLHAKLHRDAALLEKEVTSDGLFNFVVTGYSLVDWVKKDTSVPAAARTAKEVDVLYADRWLEVCGDLATAAKHFTFKKRIPITTSATSRKGWGMGRLGKGGYGVGEESIKVQLNDGTEFSALELVKGVLASWDNFFSRHGI